MRERVRELFNDIRVELIIGALIIISCILLVWELFLPPGPLENAISTANDLITIIFIVELALRYWTFEDKSQFWRTYLIDVIAVLPLFRWFRLGRALRLLRLLRALRALRLLQILSKRFSTLAWIFFKGYGDYLALLVITMFLIVTGTVMYHWYIGEHKLSLLDSIWYTIFSIIAGEPLPEVPSTVSGRLAMLFITFSGMTLFALFVGIVTTMFSVGLKRTIEAMESEVLMNLKDHVVICGYSRLAPVIIHELQLSPHMRDRYVVIVADRDEVDLEEERYTIDVSKVLFVRGDFTRASVLRRARVDRASACIILSDKGRDGKLSDQDRDARTILTALTIEKINPKIHTFLEILDYSNVEHLELGKVVDEIFIHNEFIGYVIASAVINHGLLSFLSDVLSLRTPAKISKFPIPQDLKGLTFKDVLLRLKEDREWLLLAVETNGQIIANPPSDYVLSGEEQVLVLHFMETN